MQAVVKLLRRTNHHVWTSSSSSSTSIANLEKLAWCGFDRFYTAKGSGGESSDEESSSSSRSAWEKVVAEESDSSPGPSERDSMKDADWWARDSKAKAQAMALLSAALDEAEGIEEGAGEGVSISEEDQKSLRVGVVGSPNSGKSTLTNHLVGSKVSAVSRKTNTTHKEHMGILTKGDSQLIFFDTPGLTVDIRGHPLRTDNRNRVRSAWQTAELCEALIVLVDAHRQIERPDKRVARLVEKLGNEETASQKKVLCFNKVDLVHPKRLLLPLAEEYSSYPAFDRASLLGSALLVGPLCHIMPSLESISLDKLPRCVLDVRVLPFWIPDSSISTFCQHIHDLSVAWGWRERITGIPPRSGMAVPRPWEEEVDAKPQRLARATALEIVRQHIFDRLHKELPYRIEQRHLSWRVLKDGSIRIHHLLLVEKEGHRKILVGKNGDLIRRIGTVARMELQKVLNNTVHLILDVKVLESGRDLITPLEEVNGDPLFL